MGNDALAFMLALLVIAFTISAFKLGDFILAWASAGFWALFGFFAYILAAGGQNIYWGIFFLSMGMAIVMSIFMPRRFKGEIDEDEEDEEEDEDDDTMDEMAKVRRKLQVLRTGMRGDRQSSRSRQSARQAREAPRGIDPAKRGKRGWPRDRQTPDFVKYMKKKGLW